MWSELFYSFIVLLRKRVVISFGCMEKQFHGGGADNGESSR